MFFRPQKMMNPYKQFVQLIESQVDTAKDLRASGATQVVERDAKVRIFRH